MKVCEMCGAQNDDVFTKCSVCGADLPSMNSQDGDDEKTVLIDPDQAPAQPSGLSLKTDTSTYGQADAGQTNPQPAAPQFGGMGQPQMNGMGQPQMNGMGQPGMNGMPQPGMPGQAPYGQPGFGGPTPAQPAKPKKGLIIGIIAAAVVVLAVAFVLIFKGGFGAKGGASSPEAVAQQFIEAMNDQDVDKMAALCPPFLDPGQEDIEDMLDSYSGYDVTFKYEGVESKEMYDSDDLDDLEEDISDYADKTIKLQDACDLEFSFNVAVTMSGETYDQSSTYPITCIKYKGNWYLYEYEDTDDSDNLCRYKYAGSHCDCQLFVTHGEIAGELDSSSADRNYRCDSDALLCKLLEFRYAEIREDAPGGCVGR